MFYHTEEKKKKKGGGRIIKKKGETFEYGPTSQYECPKDELDAT